jgi:hypothetical protein
MLKIGNIIYRPSSRGGWEWMDITESGENWYLTFRTESEIRAMHPGIQEYTNMQRMLDAELLADSEYCNDDMLEGLS